MPTDSPDGQQPEATPITQAAPSDCQQHYLRLHATSTAIINASFAHDPERLIAKSHSFVADLELWLEALSSRPELPVLQAAVREYQFSILALLQGQYRYSFMSLRLFFELSLASIRFSAHEIEYWLWEKGERAYDIKWARLVEHDKPIAATSAKKKAIEETAAEGENATPAGNTVLSKEFVRAFSNDAFAEEASVYRALATKVYRECSEFVHGNSQTHSIIPTTLDFSEVVMKDWLERADSIKLVVMFALCARHLKFFTPAALAMLEASITESLGHVRAVRDYLDSSHSAAE